MAIKAVPAYTAELTPEGSQYPLPSTPQILPVTPEMASDWLSYRNHPKNRPLSKGVSAKYQRDIESGRWREASPEGLIFDTDGYGVSFQHRMKALANVSADVLIEKYGEPHLSFWIFPNEPREIFDVVDQGYKRTAAHLLRVPYATSLGNGARHLAALSDGDRWGMPRFPKITTPEIVETFHAWPELTWYIKDVHGASLDADIPIGPHAAVLAQAARTAHRDLIPEWLEGTRYGLNLTQVDARLHLRRRFHTGLPAGKGKRDQAYALIVKAWNAYVNDEPVTVLRHMSTEVLPRVDGFDFTKQVKAA
ncbi:hypothetical protein AS594_06960 [Streptomyces agglomeratus]|uniref:Uncharacterized protein n=1 Tax=Streptomyces agglomeratus TaxID=285458 RepID=A0A1E5P3Z4_9ACTN|nr:hypothetical protein [Streptomyces agglomeratus]OEJ24263.1 hypothetical protein AS594_06960 [Streptomyces agglomeratus]